MREILYKAIAYDSEDWIYGMLYYSEIDHTPTLLYSNEDKKLRYIRVKSDTVCQFTGLKDEHDNRVFEGDIISNGEEQYIVVWSDDDAGFYLEQPKDIDSSFFDIDIKQFHVLTNIHDKCI